MTQGLGHDEGDFYQTVCVDLYFGFYYLAVSKKLELVEVADTAVGMQVVDIKKRQCMDKGSMV